MSQQQATHFVHQEGIRPAAKRGHLYKLYVLRLPATPAGCIEDADGVGPLLDKVHVGIGQVLAPHNVVRQDINAHACQQVAHAVLDQRVGVIRASRQQDGQGMVLAGLCQDMFVQGSQGVFELLLRLQGLVESGRDDRRRYAQPAKVFPALPVEELAVLEGDGRRVDGDVGLLYALDHLGVAGDDGAIIAVVAVRLFLEDNEGHEDAVHSFFLQVADMAMHQLGRKANVVGHDQAGTAFVDGIV